MLTPVIFLVLPVTVLFPVGVKGNFVSLLGPSYRCKLPGRVVLTIGLAMPGACVALLIVLLVGS
jgi:hypothetical protein